MTKDEFNLLNETAKIKSMHFNGIGFELEYDNGQRVSIHAFWNKKEWDISTPEEMAEKERLYELEKEKKKNRPYIIYMPSGNKVYLTAEQYRDMIKAT